MNGSDDPRRVHFQSPEYLVERLDATADLFDKDRTDVLVEAIREYIEDTADSETFQELVAAKYYDDQLDFETVKQLVGAETAQRLRLLKSDLGCSDAIRQRARTLAEESERAGVTTGVHPAGFAAACLYKAGCEHGRRLTQTEVADAANVSAATLRTHRDTLDDLVV